MLKLFQQDVSLLVIASILGCLFSNVHLIIVQLAFQILENELFPVVLVLQRFVFGFEILYLTDGIHPILFYNLVFEENVTLQFFVASSVFCNLFV